MIILKLEGGLGNQMFQYALGHNLSLIHNVQLKIDSSYLKKDNQSKRTLKIDNLKTILEEATNKEIYSYTSILQKFLDKIREKKKKIVEKSSIFDPDILSISEGYFVGHWNSEKYFKANEDKIRESFRLKNPLSVKAQAIANAITSSQSTASVHIRRGDYVSIKKIADTHGTLPISYYEEAMTKITDKFPNTDFFVFSDDIEWAKENLPKKYKLISVSTPDIQDYEELIIMSLCKNNIIANSTFSWWGAWLNNNPDKIVITPQKWYTKENITIDDLIPASWIKI